MVAKLKYLFKSWISCLRESFSILILYYIILYYIILYYIILYYIILYYIILYHIISYHIISYHIISYHIISYHIISYHIISYHIILYYIILNLTNRFHFAVRLYTDDAQMTSKHGKNKEVRYEPQASSVTDLLTIF